MKLKIAHLLILACLSVPLFAQQIIDSKQKEIVVRNVNVIPMDKEQVLANQTVVIRDGKVQAMGKNIKHANDALVIDGTGKYLIPGLAEMHAHVPPIDDLEPMKDVLALFALNGITTIRGMLGHPKHLELREMIKRGEVFGPRLYTTGPSFNGMSVTSPAAGSEMVKKQKQAGYDYLKLHPGLSREKFDSIAATAKEVGIPFAGHVSFGVGVWRAIEAGYSSIDHLDGFIEGIVPGIEKMTDQQAGPFALFIASRADTSRIKELTSALKKNNIWVVPTQSLAERWFSPSFKGENFASDPYAKYMKKETIEQWISSHKNIKQSTEFDPDKAAQFISLRRKLIKACQRDGVGLLLGCDAPQVFNVPGISTHNELAYLVDSGLTPYQALTTGTSNVGKYLRQSDSGVIKQGARADLVLLSGNPLTDIRQTQRIAGVFLNGQWLSPEYIAQGLKKLEK